MRNRFHCALAFVAVLVAPALLALPARAQGTAQFDLPAQPLGDALRAVGDQANFNVFFDPKLVEGRQAPALKARLSIIEAMSLLLQGTGLTPKLVDEKTVTFVSAAARQQMSSSPHGFQSSSPADGTGKKAKESWFNRIRLAQTDTAQSDSPARSDSSSTDAKAAPALEEIIVTAERRAESLQSLPIAISALSGEELESWGGGHRGIESLQHLAPSLVAGDRIGGYFTSVSIRGLSGTGEPGVGISQDGVPYINSMLASLDFLDIERAEVLRGPQGTIQGRNTTGGAIHIHSSRPTEEVEGGFKVTAGNYSRLGLEGHLSGPIAGERLLGRLAVRSDRADGWVTNTLLGEELGDVDLLQARASLLAPLTDNFEAHLILDSQRDRGSTVSVNGGRTRPDMQTLPELFGVPAFDPDERTLQQDQRAGVDSEKYQVTLKLAWDLGNWWPSARLTATTGYVDLDVSSLQDHNDATAVRAVAWETPLIQTVSQESQEVTLTADVTDRLDVIVGGLYVSGTDTLDIESFGFPLVGAPAGSLDVSLENDLTSWAGYTQGRYRLTDDLRLTAGIRYTHDSKETAQGTSVVKTIFNEGSWDAWTPRFALDYTPTDDLTLYASVARGFQAGAFSFDGTEVSPETVLNYEAGIKATWLDRRLKSTLTGFYMDYTNLQLVVTGVDPTGLDAIGRTITNAESTIYGMELEVDALVTERFRFTASGNWLNATMENLFNHDSLFPELGEPGPVGLNVRNLTGNRLLRAPEWQFNVSGEYRTPLPIRRGDLHGVLRASYFWRDKQYFDLFNHESLSQGAYGLVNLAAGVEGGDGTWQLTAFVHNLTDKLYRTGGGLLPLAPVTFSSFRLGPPRTYGVSLAYHF